MKRFFLVLYIGTLLPLITDAQSNPPGRFSFSTGFDLGGHATFSESRYKGTLADEDTSGAASKLFQLNAHYSVTKWFSAGLGFRVGSYIEDPNDPDTQYESNSIGEFYLDTRLYFVNRDKFNMYGNLSVGSTKLNYNYNNSPINTTQKYTGPLLRAGLGLNWYFTKIVGLWVNLDYSARKYALKEWTLNDDSQDLTDYEYQLKTKGAHFAIGLCFKLK